MYTILIIEDEPRVASLLMNGLEENGYQTMVAYDGLMGLRLFQAHTSIWSYPTSFCLRWTDLNWRKKFAKPIPISLY